MTKFCCFRVIPGNIGKDNISRYNFFEFLNDDVILQVFL